MRAQVSHKEHKSIWDKIKSFGQGEDPQVLEARKRNLSFLQQSPGWREFEKYARDRRESHVRRMLNDPKAPMEDLKARASEIDALMDWLTTQ